VQRRNKFMIGGRKSGAVKRVICVAFEINLSIVLV